MKKKEIRELRDLTVEELAKRVEEEKASLFDLRVKAKTGQMEKTSDISKSKRKIAVMQTEINSRKKQVVSEPSKA